MGAGQLVVAYNRRNVVTISRGGGVVGRDYRGRLIFSIAKTKSVMATCVSCLSGCGSVSFSEVLCFTGGTTGVGIKHFKGSVMRLSRILGKCVGMLGMRRVVGGAGKGGIIFAGKYFSIVRTKRVSLLRGTGRGNSVLIMKLGSSSSVEELGNGDHPIGALGREVGMLSSVRCVSCVIIFSSSAPLRLVRTVGPGILMGNKSCGFGRVVKTSFIAGGKKRIFDVPFMCGLSSAGVVSGVGL